MPSAPELHAAGVIARSHQLIRELERQRAAARAAVNQIRRTLTYFRVEVGRARQSVPTLRSLAASFGDVDPGDDGATVHPPFGHGVEDH
jgi:hypothetical protein